MAIKSTAEILKEMGMDEHDLHKMTYEAAIDTIIFGQSRAEMAVEDWLNVLPHLLEQNKNTYPNAKTAAQIKASPLAKALE